MKLKVENAVQRRAKKCGVIFLVCEGLHYTKKSYLPEVAPHKQVQDYAVALFSGFTVLVMIKLIEPFG